VQGLLVLALNLSFIHSDSFQCEGLSLVKGLPVSTFDLSCIHSVRVSVKDIISARTARPGLWFVLIHSVSFRSKN